ncbi:hypothetical protein QBC39DRAFT_93839 [Podospora conica]|nr:hypothetical protein QBC39DRAFT_93839 [Schizothecium conicum]
MGLLSFLSKKRLGDKARAKTQPVDVPPRTVVPEQALAPTISLDLEELRGRPGSSKVVTASNTDLSPDYAAPAPAVPLFREESVERPSTAPNGKASSTAWVSPVALLRKNQVRGAAPPVSFRTPRPSTANPVPAPNSSAGSIRTFTGHSRTNSLLSENGTRSKDLLDAQSEIRPADFKSRVRASGARDYGEDVADRNIGENGIELQSPAVQAFYAQAEADPVLINGGRFAHHKSSSSLSSGYGFRSKMRRNTLTPQGGPVDSISLSDSNSNLVRRRQSVNTYLPPSSVGNESDPTSRRRSGLRVVTNSIMTPKPEKPAWDLSAFPSLGLKTPIVFGPPRTPRLASGTRPSSARPSTEGSPRIPRESLVSARQIATDDAISFSPPLRSPTRSRRGSANGPGTYPRKCHSLQTLQYTYTSPSTTRDPLSDITPLSYPRHRQTRTAKQTVSEGYTTPDPDSVVIDFDIAASPTRSLAPSRSQYLKTPFTIHEAQEEAPDADPAPIVDNIPRTSLFSEGSPVRARSTRGWSVSSATPTASDTSSNPFPRGTHTANTSVDLSSLKKVPSHASSDHLPPAAAVAIADSTFNIDDYLSSDDDSFTAEQPRRPRAEGEEDLLFADTGYGHDFQLPGLCDAFPTTTAPTTQNPDTESPIPFYGPPNTANASRRFILDTAADSDSDASEEESDFIPRPIAAAATPQKTKRLSALCSPAATAAGRNRRRPSFAPIVEEERGGGRVVDVAAAVRLRKETKARRRASGMPTSAAVRRTRAVAVVIRVEAPEGDDEVNYADVEEE